MIIVNGSASSVLAKRLARALHAPLARTETRRFPDGECYVRVLDDLEDEEVVLVQNAYPDENIIELFLLQDAIRELGAANLTMVVPYMGYARQDKRFQGGEALSARAILSRLWADKLITVDVHNEMVLRYFKGEARNISGMPALGEYLKRLEIDVVLAPDMSATKRAAIVARAVGRSHEYLDKKRIDATRVVSAEKVLDLKGQNVAVVDDIISTGCTMVNAVEFLKGKGAERVYCVCTHGVFADDALPRLKSICSGVFSTDTIENETSTVTVAREVRIAL